MTSQNFDHPIEIDRPLAIPASHAECYFVDNANTALIKTRQFAERLAYLISENAGVTIDGEPTFSDTLRIIRRDNLAPSEILDVLHRLRIESNSAVHGNESERRLAFEAVKLCHRLGVWLRASVSGNPKLTMAFVPPKLATDDSEELRFTTRPIQQTGPRGRRMSTGRQRDVF